MEFAARGREAYGEVEAVAQANTYRSIGASVPSAPAASRAAPDVLIGTASSLGFRLLFRRRLASAKQPIEKTRLGDEALVSLREWTRKWQRPICSGSGGEDCSQSGIRTGPPCID